MSVFQKTILLTKVSRARTVQLNSVGGREAIWLFPKVFLPAAQGEWGLLLSAPCVEPVSSVCSDGPVVTSLSCRVYKSRPQCPGSSVFHVTLYH